MIGVNSPETNDPTEKEIIDKMFNAKLVKEGYAQTYTYQPDSKYCIVLYLVLNRYFSLAFCLNLIYHEDIVVI